MVTLYTFIHLSSLFTFSYHLPLSLSALPSSSWRWSRHCIGLPVLPQGQWPRFVSTYCELDPMLHALQRLPHLILITAPFEVNTSISLTLQMRKWKLRFSSLSWRESGEWVPDLTPFLQSLASFPLGGGHWWGPCRSALCSWEQGGHSGEVVREASDRPSTESPEKRFWGGGRAPKLSSQKGGWPVMRGLHFHYKSLNDQEPQGMQRGI